jgi:hypothetical protein
MTGGRWSRWAGNRVDLAHVAASSRPDPVAYLRECQAKAERQWVEGGDARSLALARAFAASLDGRPS